MKKYLFFLAASFLSLYTHAQYVTISDTAFVSFLKQNYPACMTGNQMDTTCPAIVNAITMQFSPPNYIQNLAGIQYFDKLDTLISMNPALGTLPALPPSLRRLYCTSGRLTNLPPLPVSLTSLSCGGNDLVILPTLPISLIDLSCGYNELDSLPQLPPSLTYLYCTKNKLTSLPSLPPSLTYLFCDQNQLTTLPAIPPSVYQLNCSYNQLTSLPPLPSGMYEFKANNNPNLRCLPPIKRFAGGAGDFSIANTSIHCLPNVISHFSSIPAIDTMPICDLFNQNGCVIARNIQGELYQDENGDCQRQSAEIRANAPAKINLYWSGNLVESFYSNSGNYSFDVAPSTYRVEVDTTDLPLAISCKNDTTLELTVNDSLKYNIDFGLRCKPGFDVGAKSIFGSLFRPANATLIDINAGDMANQYGLNCATGTGGAVTITITGPAKYVSPATGALIPSLVNNNIITWNVADFGTTVFDSSFNIIVSTDTLAQAGQKVCFTVSLTPTAGDNNTANNTLTQCYEVRTSFDPNDKQAYPSGNTDTADKWITYTVRFQNTGNDTAIHIYILDTLSSYLDESTFQLLTASHKNITQVYGNGIVKFNFPNIMLPDSNMNEVLSHGYLQYKVKRKEDLLLGTQIENTAYIYFDFNAPVVTNTTTNTLYAEVATTMPVEYEQQVLQLYPNPANQTVFIAATGFVPQWISLYDVSGRKIMEQPYSPQLDIHTLTSGVYLVEVRNQYTNARSRVVKM